jgi:hypothetical protein
MLNTWKDWTGARHIYLNLPDELGLTRITLYQREAPHNLSLFMYIVLVECRAITSMEHQVYNSVVLSCRNSFDRVLCVTESESSSP